MARLEIQMSHSFYSTPCVCLPDSKNRREADSSPVKIFFSQRCVVLVQFPVDSAGSSPSLSLSSLNHWVSLQKAHPTTSSSVDWAHVSCITWDKDCCDNPLKSGLQSQDTHSGVVLHHISGRINIMVRIYSAKKQISWILDTLQRMSQIIISPHIVWYGHL